MPAPRPGLVGLECMGVWLWFRECDCRPRSYRGFWGTSGDVFILRVCLGVRCRFLQFWIGGSIGELFERYMLLDRGALECMNTGCLNIQGITFVEVNG